MPACISTPSARKCWAASFLPAATVVTGHLIFVNCIFLNVTVCFCCGSRQRLLLHRDVLHVSARGFAGRAAAWRHLSRTQRNREQGSSNEGAASSCSLQGTTLLNSPPLAEELHYSRRNWGTTHSVTLPTPIITCLLGSAEPCGQSIGSV